MHRPLKFNNNFYFDIYYKFSFEIIYFIFLTSSSISKIVLCSIVDLPNWYCDITAVANKNEPEQPLNS